ncbi:unnamed protein product [Ectocarpus sp. CCAP 1310/34]|nr:unnamed protein product [Ectocarpus sp. CCAP 1310/34]
MLRRDGMDLELMALGAELEPSPADSTSKERWDAIESAWGLTQNGVFDDEEWAYIAGDGTGKGQAGGGRGSKSNGRGNKKKAGTDDRVDHRRCFRCNHRGHRKPDCTTKEEDFLEQCVTCSGFGHNSEKCATPTEEACMAVVEHAKFAVVSFEEQYDRAEELCKMDPSWEKLTEDEEEAKVQEVITESF